MTASLRIQSSKADSNTCESFTRSGLKLESVHQESPRSDVFRKRATKPLLNQRQRQKQNWPANSPDLNPIENLWGIVKRKRRDTRPNNADDLKATVKETWASIPPQQCHKLITSMPHRIEALIKAKGAPTKY